MGFSDTENTTAAQSGVLVFNSVTVEGQKEWKNTLLHFLFSTLEYFTFTIV